MKNILVPTDFTVQSLNAVHEIVKMHPTETVSIYLIHMVHTPDDIQDLLFSGKRQLMAQVPNTFIEAMEVLRNKYNGTIDRLGLEFYYGSRASVLNSIIENRKIDEVCFLDRFTYARPFSQSVNMIALLDRCKVPVRKLRRNGKVMLQGEGNLLSSLLMENNVFVSTKERSYPVS